MKKLIPLLLLTCLSASCLKTVPLRSESSGSVPPNLTIKQVENAIREAAIDKGWTLSDAGKNAFDAKLVLRKHVLVVNIPYSTTDYKIIYKSSEGLEYDPGAKVIHRKYNTWVRNLQLSIDRKLAVAK